MITPTPTNVQPTQLAYVIAQSDEEVLRGRFVIVERQLTEAAINHPTQGLLVRHPSHAVTWWCRAATAQHLLPWRGAQVLRRPITDRVLRPVSAPPQAEHATPTFKELTE